MAMQQECVVTNECLFELIDFFATRGTQYLAKLTDRKYEVVDKMCLHLLARDYYIQSIDNSEGTLCPHYPSHIIILERDASERDKRKSINDVKQLNDLFTAARSARCFCRFPVPVILYNKKNICRSSTLSTAAELYGRNGLEWIFSGSKKNLEEDLPSQRERKPSEWALVDQAREYDSQLVKNLGVGLICDLMVEMRKTAYGMTVTSSEKADGSHWYSDFTIASIPYPGCEFFHKYRSNSKYAEELHYDWSKSLNDATLSVPSPLPESAGISFNNYQSWSVVNLTQTYLKLILHYIKHEESGILVHCISGWDRTPLYISLIRLSLWADGLIHSSLKPSEILYLTLAYDWFMFGHKFEERLKKNEEIMYFCFDFLKYITSDDYSLEPNRVEQLSKVTPTCTSATSTEDTSTREGDVTPLPSNNVTGNDTNVRNSLYQVSMNAFHGNCLYQPSICKGRSPTHQGNDSPLPTPDTRRGSSLLTVRELFLNAYQKALPRIVDGGGGASGQGGGVGVLSGIFGHKRV